MYGSNATKHIAAWAVFTSIGAWCISPGFCNNLLIIPWLYAILTVLVMWLWRATSTDQQIVADYIYSKTIRRD